MSSRSENGKTFRVADLNYVSLYFVERAAEFEELLGFRQYSTRPRAGLRSSFKAMRLFFIGLMLFWASSFIWYGR